MARKKKASATLVAKTTPATARLYTLDVAVIAGPIDERFAEKNPVISRTIQIRGDQTLLDLHDAIFTAFDRWDEHMYEFQFGKGPMDPAGQRYVMPDDDILSGPGGNKEAAGYVDRTTLESLGLTVDRAFGYWFDFGDDWWHQIDVVAIADKVPKGKFPKVTKRVGKSPPQYSDE